MRALLVFCLHVLVVLLLAGTAQAEVFHAPVGGRPFVLGEGRVVCGAPPTGWIVEGAGRALKPPTAKEALGKVVELTIAASPALCQSAPRKARAVATGKIPVLDRASVTLFVDEGRIEADGTAIDQSLVSWPLPGDLLEADTCSLSPPPPGLKLGPKPTVEHCIWSVTKSLPVNPGQSPVRLWPQGSLVATDAVLFDAEGRRIAPASLALTPKKVQIASVLPQGAGVDVSSGFGLLPLLHPDAVAEVECRGAQCRIEGGQLRVQAPPEGVGQIEARFTITAGVATAKPGPVVGKVTILRCPMDPVSGPAFRGLQSARVIVKLGAGCARDVDSLRFLAGTRSVDVVEKISLTDATYVVLSLGLIDAEAVTLTAVRTGAEGAVVAIAKVQTRVAPAARSVLEIPGFPGVDFLPYNRDAAVHFPKIEGGELTLLPVDGVYSVQHVRGATLARGDRNAAGLATFQFAFRANALPKPLSEVDLATFSDPLQRTIKEANEPAPFGLSAATDKPLAEVLCTDSDGKSERLKPGVQARISYRLREGCRLVLHRERLRPELGAQKVHIEIEVRKLDGSLRGEASVSERVVLRPGTEPKLAWVKGVQAPYDSVVIRLTHEGDEMHYLGGESLLNKAPAVQWPILFGTGRVRIYATTAIPTGLYRFGGKEGSGPLALNFGVLSRMTWVDRDGKEGLLGLEAGVMAFGLTGNPSTTGQSLTQVGAVIGAGLSIPIANASQATQAAINLHGWFEQRLTGPGEGVDSPRAFIFGPSISIGNIGGTF